EAVVIGTVRYMAPEQAAGRQVGTPADLYAMGVVLYEALTGQVLSSGPTAELLVSVRQPADAANDRARRGDRVLRLHRTSPRATRRPPPPHERRALDGPHRAVPRPRARRGACPPRDQDQRRSPPPTRRRARGVNTGWLARDRPERARVEVEEGI